MFDDNDTTDIKLTINKAYANKYEHWRQKEEKQKLIARYGSDIEDDEDSNEESEDDHAEKWTDEVEKEFFRCYSILKKRDPAIYDAQTRFFNNMTESSDAEIESKPSTKEKKNKSMFLKEAEIQYAMAEAEKNGPIEDESLTKSKKTKNSSSGRIETKKSIAEEEEEIKQSFKKLVETSMNDDDDDVLLKKKVKTEVEKEKEEKEFIEWLKGQKSDISDATMKSDLNYLRDYWNNESLSDRDRFLRDYILNKMYLTGKDDDDPMEFPSYDELINEDEDEDEDELEKAEEFERKYNFRYQEPDAEFLKRYPRTIEDSVRRKDDHRKLKRAERKQRKELERKQKLEEIKRLKNLKKKEIFEKMKKLKRVAGDDRLPLSIDDLDADFDPKEYDRRMQQMFNDDYYQKGGDEEEKPEVSDEELQVETCDDAEVKETVKATTTQTQVEQTTNKKKKKKKNSKEKPIFDPNEKTFEEYFDEYYKLDCEDFIGDMPVRFQYRQVEPNDFGLTIDEILAAEDRELNAWCSLKKTSQYRSKEEEIRDRHVYRNKAKQFEKKRKVLASVYQPKEEQDESVNHSNIGETSETTNQANETKEATKKKHKTKHLSEEQRLLTDMPDERLQMYGLNPNRFKKFVRFNKDKLKK